MYIATWEGYKVTTIVWPLMLNVNAPSEGNSCVISGSGGYAMLLLGRDSSVLSRGEGGGERRR